MMTKVSSYDEEVYLLFLYIYSSLGEDTPSFVYAAL